MAVKASPDFAFLIIGGMNIRSRVMSTSDVEEEITEETTPVGDAYDSYEAVGQTKWDLEFEGFYDDAVNAINEALNLSGSQVLMYAEAGGSIGSDFLGSSAIRTVLEKRSARGELHKTKGAYKADVGPDRGRIGADLVARTAAGPSSTATLDWGVSYANQITGSIIAYLGVIALTLGGATGLQVKVRDSDDDITYANVLTFTTVAAAPNSERISLAAAAVPNDIERYTQVQWQFTGVPGGSQTATFAVGIARPTS